MKDTPGSLSYSSALHVGQAILISLIFLLNSERFRAFHSLRLSIYFLLPSVLAIKASACLDLYWQPLHILYSIAPTRYEGYNVVYLPPKTGSYGTWMFLFKAFYGCLRAFYSTRRCSRNILFSITIPSVFCHYWHR